MKAATTYGPRIPLNWMRMGLVLLAFAGLGCLMNEAAHAQDAAAKGQDSPGKAQDASGKPQTAPAKPDSGQSEEIEAPAATLHGCGHAGRVRATPPPWPRQRFPADFAAAGAAAFCFTATN